MSSKKRIECDFEELGRGEQAEFGRIRTEGQRDISRRISTSRRGFRERNRPNGRIASEQFFFLPTETHFSYAVVNRPDGDCSTNGDFQW